jgi:hypothetical protein
MSRALTTGAPPRVDLGQSGSSHRTTFSSSFGGGLLCRLMLHLLSPVLLPLSRFSGWCWPGLKCARATSNGDRTGAFYHQIDVEISSPHAWATVGNSALPLGN